MKRCFVYMAAFIMALCISCSNGDNKDNAKKENVNFSWADIPLPSVPV